MAESYLPFCRPSIDSADIEAVVEVLRSGWITTGPATADLERLFCERLGTEHAVAMSSATAAMHCFLFASGIGPGDEVITPSMTWVSTVNLITLVGATPVFVDVDRDNLMVTASRIEQAVTPKTRLIIPVHFAGAPLDLDPIQSLAAEHGIPLVEDAAHALGAGYRGRNVGSSGDTIFSLQAIKNVTGAEGGVFVTDDGALAERMRRLRFHGLGTDANDRNAQSRKPQSEVLAPGFKYNPPDLCSALALSQMRRMEQMNRRRRDIAAYYDEALRNVPAVSPLVSPPWPHIHARHLYVIRLTEQSPLTRDEFIEAMRERQIGCGIHFPAIHLQKYYAESNAIGHARLPNTEWNSQRICSIPLFPGMTDEDAARVVDTTRSLLQS